MPLMGLLVDWTQVRKTTLSQKIYQQKILSKTEKQRLKKVEQNIQGFETTIKIVTYA